MSGLKGEIFVSDTLKTLFVSYIFYYPVVMSLVWILGGLCFYWRRERHTPQTPPPLSRYPLVSVFIPAHNEEDCIAEAVQSIFSQHYPKLEVIVINDASTDRTQEILDGLMKDYPDLRVLHLQKNMGKAHGLNLALAISHGEIIVTLDADSMLDEHAVEWAVWHFNTFPRVGAVTGNPRVRNRTTLLAKIQTAEYSSVIGLIKRAQRLMGKVMTVSGVVAAWRRSAVVHAGLWDTKAITDDIEMTWRLETKFWDVRYETNMLCWMLVPESLSGLWKQRCRWAQGGVEVMRRHYDVWKDWRQRRIWPIYVDYFLGTCWAYAFTIYLCAWLVMALCQLFTAGPAVLADLLGTSPFWGWNGAIVAVICLLQLFTSLCIDSRYEPGLWRLMIWVVWYPLAYWAFNSFATVAATPRGLFRNMDKAATWASPDRGLRS